MGLRVAPAPPGGDALTGPLTYAPGAGWMF
jgi:hypothetical protein